jgi:phage terminase large subunit-like protein
MRNLDRLRTGDEVLTFMAESLVHGPGSFEGEPWRPLPWQADLVHALYDPRRPDGRRQVDRALLLTPKGAGKTDLAGALAVVELVIRESAEVVIAASTWHQVSLLKASADGCCSHTNSALAGLVEITEAEIRLRHTSSHVTRVASDAGGNDGLRPTCLIRDETHEWNTPSRERNHLVLSNGLSKRGGLQLDISTVGADRESLLGRYDDYCRRVAEGEVRDPHLLYVAHSAEGLEVDLDTDEGLREAIVAANPSARGEGAFVDVDDVMRRFREIPRPEGKRYFLNVWPDGGSEQWLPEGSWAALADPKRRIPKGAPVFVGFDGSTTRDSTALVVVTPDEGGQQPHAAVVAVWEKPEGIDRWLVPRDEVLAVVDELFATFEVRRMAVDPWGWRPELESWQKTYGDRVVEFDTTRPIAFADACATFYAAVVNGQLSHTGDAVPRDSGASKRTTITKVHKASPRYIDAAVALVLAYFAAGEWEPPPPKRSKVPVSIF